MAITSDFYTDEGIHRVAPWRIALFALNNTATNLYLILLNFISFYLAGPVGLGLTAAASILLALRVCDFVTDPMLGLIMNKTNGKFGKNRPFMVIGNVLMLLMSALMVHLPGSTVLGTVLFILYAVLFFLGYTLQTSATRSAQMALTTDPKQRPLFAAFDAVYTVALVAVFAMIVPGMAKVTGADMSEAFDASFFNTLWLICALVSLVLTVAAVVGVAPKDHPAFYGASKTAPVSKQDFWGTVKENKSVKLLMLAVVSDKLSFFGAASAVASALFAVLTGTASILPAVAGIAVAPAALAAFALVFFLGAKLGGKKSVLIGAWGGVVVNAALACLWLASNPASMNAEGKLGWGMFTILFLVMTVLQAGFRGLTGMVIPMTADCVEDEAARSGKYIPSIIGGLMAFADKITAAVAIFVSGLVFALGASAVSLILVSYGMAAIGMLLAAIAMMGYPKAAEKAE